MFLTNAPSPVLWVWLKHAQQKRLDVWKVGKIHPLVSGIDWLHCTRLDENHKILTVPRQDGIPDCLGQRVKGTSSLHVVSHFTALLFGYGWSWWCAWEKVEGERTAWWVIIILALIKYLWKAFLRVRFEIFLNSHGLNHTTGPIIFLERNNISSNPSAFVLICLNWCYPRILRGTTAEDLVGC